MAISLGIYPIFRHTQMGVWRWWLIFRYLVVSARVSAIVFMLDKGLGWWSIGIFWGRLAESSQNDWACTRILNIGKCACFTLPQWLNEIDNMLDQILGLFEKMLPLICSDLSLCFPFKPLIFEGVICVIHSCTCHAFGIAKKGWNEQR